MLEEEDVVEDIKSYEGRSSRLVESVRKKQSSSNSLYKLDALNAQPVHTQTPFTRLTLYCFTINYILGVGILGIPKGFEEVLYKPFCHAFILKALPYEHTHLFI